MAASLSVLIARLDDLRARLANAERGNDGSSAEYLRAEIERQQRRIRDASQR